MISMNGFSLMRRKLTTMSAAEKKIALVILNDQDAAIRLTTSQLATKAGVSEGSVINFAIALGFDGFSSMKINLAKNLVSPDAPSEADGTPRQIMRAIINRTMESLESTFDTLGPELGQAADLLYDADSILVFGLAHSAPIARDVAFRLMRIGLNVQVIEDPLTACMAATRLTQRSVALAVSHMGRTKDVLDICKTAKNAGASVVGLSCHADTPLTRLCDLSLIAVASEVTAYKEPVVSRLTQLLLGDCLCALIARRMGSEAPARLNKMVEVFEATGKMVEIPPNAGDGR